MKNILNKILSAKSFTMTLTLTNNTIILSSPMKTNHKHPPFIKMDPGYRNLTVHLVCTLRNKRKSENMK